MCRIRVYFAIFVLVPQSQILQSNGFVLPESAAYKGKNALKLISQRKEQTGVSWSNGNGTDFRSNCNASMGDYILRHTNKRSD